MESDWSTCPLDPVVSGVTVDLGKNHCEGLLYVGDGVVRGVYRWSWVVGVNSVGPSGDQLFYS